jgi:AmmeMemoRadiSam system protein B
LAKAAAQALLPTIDEKSALMVMAPHAGYVYSGKTAGNTFAQVKVSSKILLLGAKFAEAVKRHNYQQWSRTLSKARKIL